MDRIQPTSRQNHKREIISLAYNPNKNYTELFLEDLIKGIDYAFAEGRHVTLIGDYNINYRSLREKKKLEEMIKPYALTVTNKSNPTRYTGKSNSIIDYCVM